MLAGAHGPFAYLSKTKTLKTKKTRVGAQQLTHKTTPNDGVFYDTISTSEGL
jgi:hypothetical protein